MPNLKKYIVNENTSIYKTIKLINKNENKTLLVVKKDFTFKGTITDGDVRRALINGINIKSKVKGIYNNNPHFFYVDKINLKIANKEFEKNKYDIIPIISKNKKLKDILEKKNIHRSAKIKKKLKNCSIIITAGGKGTRLSPFTKVLPKPLVPINGKPILERIIEKFREFNITKFYLTTHYKSRIIEAYLKETYLAPFVEIVYEKKPLGTIGSLSNLKKLKSKFLIITTCDTLINIDYKKFLDSHLKDKNAITIAAAKYKYSIPYGVCDISKNNQLINLIEKPKYFYLMNSGLYIFNKKLLNLMQDNRYIDFDKFLKKIQTKNHKVGVFKINSANVQDFGKWNDFEKSIKK